MPTSLLSDSLDESKKRHKSEIYALVNTSALHRANIHSPTAEVSEKRKRFLQQRALFDSRILELREMLVAIDARERLRPKTLPGWPI